MGGYRCDMCGGVSDSPPYLSGCERGHNHAEWRRKQQDSASLAALAEAAERQPSAETLEVFLERLYRLEARVATLEARDVLAGLEAKEGAT